MRNTLYFLLGATIGAMVTNYIIKEHYKNTAEKEIESVINCFRVKSKIAENDENSKKKEEHEEYDENSKKKEEHEEYEKYKTIIKNNYYNKSKKASELNETTEHPYIIAPDEFGEFPDYEKITLTHYFDGVLADDLDEIIDNVNEVVGNDYHNHFGEYEKDSVYIRNDAKKCDYEILYDRRDYHEITNNPRKVKISD